MKLTNKDLPSELVDVLATFNISQVEQFVSMTTSERTLQALMVVSGLTRNQLKHHAHRLIRKFPHLRIPEPHSQHYPVGYKI
jgi:hypothetical protein